MPSLETAPKKRVITKRSIVTLTNRLLDDYIREKKRKKPQDDLDEVIRKVRADVK